MEAGRNLGRYELIELIGRGGMGEVWRARDPRLNRDVALKLLSREVAPSAEALHRLEHEARAIAALSHPNVLAVFDFGLEDGMPFVVTELLEGHTLRERLSRNGPLPWTEAARIGSEIAAGLAAAHARGVLHRDLKPENIFITLDDRVKILDFGLARIVTPQANSETTDSYLTEPGKLMGTAGYIAPEQLRGNPATAKSDLFALGCVLYEMVTGERPFDGSSVPEVIAAVLKEEPRPLEPSLAPPALVKLIRDCLEKDPSRRIASAEDVVRHLERSTTETVETAIWVAPLRSRYRPAIIALIFLAIVIATVLAVNRRRSLATSGPPRLQSIAVLPFEGATRDPAVEYLTEGVPEGIINTLSELEDIRVVSRASSFRFRNSALDLQKIRRELGVDCIVTGRIARVGDRLAIDAGLIDPRTDAQLWGRKFVVPLGDLVSVEREITREIIDELKLEVTTAEQSRLSRRLSTDSEAYRLYLLGRYHWNRLTPEGVSRAISWFKQAIERDPNYALAYSGLADCHIVLGVHGRKPHDEMPKAREAALKAVALDPYLAEGHTSLGGVKLYYDWDWKGAEAELSKAIELNPKYPTAHHAHALFLMRVGRAEEAVEAMRRAVALDPFALVINVDVATALYYAGRVQEAIDQLEHTAELHPTSPLVHRNLAMFLEDAGRYDEMVRELRREAELLGKPPGELAQLDEIRRTKGIEAFRRARFERELAAGAPPYRLAALSAAIDPEAALRFLSQAIDQRDSNAGVIKVAPRFAPLRHHPKFRELVARVGLPAI